MVYKITDFIQFIYTLAINLIIPQTKYGTLHLDKKNEIRL